MNERSVRAAVGERRVDAGKLCRPRTGAGCEAIGKRAELLLCAFERYGRVDVVNSRAGRHASRGARRSYRSSIKGTAVDEVGVDHRGSDIAVAKQGLDGTDVGASFGQMGSEAVAQGRAGGPSIDVETCMKVGDRGLGGERRAKSILDRGGLTALLGDYLPWRVKYTVSPI